MSLCELLSAALQEACGQSEDDAQSMASDIIAWGAEHGHAGMRHYWPARFGQLAAAQRDSLIRSEFTGSNLKSICEKYGVSHETVYKAVRHS